MTPTDELAPTPPALTNPRRYWQWRRSFADFWRTHFEPIHHELQGQPLSTEYAPVVAAQIHTHARDSILRALPPPLAAQYAYLAGEPTGYLVLSALDRLVGEPLDERATQELESLQQCNLARNESFTAFRVRFRATLEWIELYGYSIGADQKLLHLHRQFFPYYPALCHQYMRRFVNIIKHRRRIERWDVTAAPLELQIWKRTERALNELLRDFVTDISRADADPAERKTVAPPPHQPSPPETLPDRRADPAVDQLMQDLDHISLAVPGPGPGTGAGTGTGAGAGAGAGAETGNSESLRAPPVARSLPEAGDTHGSPPPPQDSALAPPSMAVTATAAATGTPTGTGAGTGTGVGTGTGSAAPPSKAATKATLTPAPTTKSTPTSLPLPDSSGGPAATPSSHASNDRRQRLRSALLRSADREPSWDPARPTLYQALTGEHAEEWLTLVQAKMVQLEQLNSWDVVDWAAPGLAKVREEHTLLTAYFIFKVSPGSAGERPMRHVYLGVREEVPSHQPTPMSLRTLLVALCQKRFNSHESQLIHFDYINPWLNEPLEEGEAEYIVQPPGFATRPPGMLEPVLKLRRALYAVDNGKNSWARSAWAALERLGFHSVEGSTGIFYDRAHGVVVALYVDEIICLGRSKEIEMVREILQPVFRLRNPRPLARQGSLEIKTQPWFVQISQSSEIHRLLSRLGVDKDTGSQVPLPPTPVSSSAQTAHPPVAASDVGGSDERTDEPHMSITKRQWYTYTYNKLKVFAHGTRPDIAYALLRLSPRARRTVKEADYAALWRLVFYLKRTVDTVLTLGPGSGSGAPSSHPSPKGTTSERLSIHGAVAPSPVVTVDTPHFVGGGAFYLGTSLVHWYWSFIKEFPADQHEASYINAAQAVYQAGNLYHLVLTVCPELHRDPLLGGTIPRMFFSDSLAVEEILAHYERSNFSTDSTVGRCFRYVRSRTLPLSRDRTFDLVYTTKEHPSLARGLVLFLDKEAFLAWRTDLGVTFPPE